MTAHTLSTISITDGLIQVGDRRLPLLAGEVQFWRMNPVEWADALDQVVALGIPIVSTYLSWRRHEPVQGQFIWGPQKGADADGETEEGAAGGEADPALNARLFVQMCADRNLLVQIKPGPWICAEEPGGGYPDWLMAMNSELAISAGGKPLVGYNPPFLHPVPSPSSGRYRAAVAAWFAEVWAQLGDLRYPAGPIVAVQLDNEPSLAFQDAMYFADYHPATVERFGPWLRDRYGKLSAWQAAWGRAAGADFDTAQPPRPATATASAVDLIGQVDAPTAPSRAADHDWAAFMEYVLVDHLDYLAGVHESLGAGHLLSTVNIINHPIHDTGMSHRAVRDGLAAPGRPTAAVGVDHYYVPPLTWDDIGRLACTAATARAAGEPIVWAPELMAGIWRSPGEIVDYPDPTAVEQEAWWGLAIALGYTGFNLYMLVNRENWEYAPVNRDGSPATFAAAVKALTDITAAHPSLLQARPQHRVSLLWHQPDIIDAYTVTGTARHPEVPWHDPARAAHYTALTSVQAALLRHGHGYEFWDPQYANLPETDVLVIVEPTTVPDEYRQRAQAAGVTVITVTSDSDLGSLLTPFPPQAYAASTATMQAFASIAEAPDGSRYLHLVTWGSDSGQHTKPVTVVTTPSTPDATYVNLADGSTVKACAGRLTVPGFLGHRIYREH